MKNRIIFFDVALLVAGVIVILLIASSALGWTWTARLGSLVVVWPNRLRHILFAALALVIVTRILLSPSHRIPFATSGARRTFASSRFVNRWLLGGIVGLLTVAISLRTFKLSYFRNIPYYELHYDMARWVLERPLERLPLIVVPGHEWGGIRAGYFRPIAVLTYLVDLVWGAAPAGVLMFNVVLYSILAVQVGFLAWRLTEDSRVVWAATLLFALFPLRSEMLLEIAHRDEILYSLFYLCALIAFIDFGRTQDRGKLVWALGAFLLAILSKEQGFSFPILLGFYAAASSIGTWSSRLKRVFVITTPYLAIALLLMLYRVAAQGSFVGGHHAAPWLFRRLVTLGSLVFYGLVYPIPLTVIPPSTPRLLAVALLSTPLLFLLWTRSFDWRLAFLLGAVPISASVSSTIIELTETGQTVWYFTLPSAFFSIALAASVLVLPAKKVRRSLSLPLLTLYVALYATILSLSQGMLVMDAAR